ncbi:MAG TPA: hypothetical protein DC054_04365 [Blastocatellia bacterium]|nr:hypothetical protein [Blastocatellia bacterium]
MKKDWALVKESFDALLAWLDSDPEIAACKYEVIRSRLIKIFVCRGCHEPEDLADETIDRVARKLDEIRTTFTGEPIRYFYGVANKVHLEYLRRKPPPVPPPPSTNSAEIEREYDCLERCMQHLAAGNRELVLQYYQEDKQAKIENRQRLADRLGIAVNALRIRACRIRASLLACVQECIDGVAV